MSFFLKPLAGLYAINWKTYLNRTKGIINLKSKMFTKSHFFGQLRFNLTLFWCDLFYFKNSICKYVLDVQFLQKKLNLDVFNIYTLNK